MSALLRVGEDENYWCVNLTVFGANILTFPDQIKSEISQIPTGTSLILNSTAIGADKTASAHLPSF
jgi:hypothetical protein